MLIVNRFGLNRIARSQDYKSRFMEEPMIVSAYRVSRRQISPEWGGCVPAAHWHYYALAHAVSAEITKPATWKRNPDAGLSFLYRFKMVEGTKPYPNSFSKPKYIRKSCLFNTLPHIKTLHASGRPLILVNSPSTNLSSKEFNGMFTAVTKPLTQFIQHL